MGKFEKLKDLLLALVVTIIGFSIRLAIRSSQKYYMNLDGYTYLNVAKTGILRNEPVLLNWMAKYFGIFYTDMVLWGFTCLTFILFYYLCRRYTSKFSSFLASLFFAVSPLVFFNNQFGLFDKNVYSLFMIVLIMMFMFRKVDKSKTITNVSILFCAFLFSYMWQGFWCIIVVYVFYLLIQSMVLKKLDHTSYLYVIVGLLLYAGFGSFKGIARFGSGYLTTELSPIYYVGLFSEYLIMVLVYIFLFTKLRLEKKDKNKLLEYLPLYVGFVIAFFAMVATFRMNILFLPFLYLGFAVMFNEFDYKWYWKTFVYLLLISFVVLTSMDIYLREPIMNDDLKEAIDMVNSQPTDCIVGLWDKGYIYEYYSDKDVLFKASDGSWKAQLDYFVFGKEHNCSTIYSETDLEAIRWMIEQKDVNAPPIWLGLGLTRTFGEYHVLYDIKE